MARVGRMGLHKHLPGREGDDNLEKRTVMAKMKSGKKRAARDRDAQSHLQQALHFHQQQQFDAALKSYGRAITLNPDFAEAYSNRGLLYMHTGERELALADFDRAIALNPNFAKAYSNRGLLYVRARKKELALTDLNRAIALDPCLAGAYSNRGFLYTESGEHELALADFDLAVELNPDFFDAHNYRGVALAAMKQFKPALDSFEKALLLNPSSAEVHNNIGMVFLRNGQLDIALEYYEIALDLDPNLGAAYCSYGSALLRLNQFDAAMEYFDKAIALDPDDVFARYNKAFPLLLQGRFEEGLPLYEYRFELRDPRLKKIDVPGRLWLGEESVEGKTILLRHDAGLGDTIQFCRYASQLSAMGAKVILEAPPVLSSLLKNLKGMIELAEYRKELTLQALDQYPPFDVYCPIVSLPLALKTTLDTIPGETPYLYADPEKVAAWEKRLGRKTKLRVGLVWSGNAEHANDKNRSIVLAQLLPYLPDNCEYIGLQKDIRDIDRVIFAAMTEWKHYEEDLHDFSDTAALCSLMDVVVSVDTSVAHLCGALGIPTWLLLPFSPDWRWLLERRDSPWYASMRLYRQSEPGNWNAVFEEVRLDLLALPRGG